MSVEYQWLHERARPSLGPVVQGNPLMPRMKVFKGAGAVSLGEPVGDEKGEIEVAIAEGRRQ